MALPYIILTAGSVSALQDLITGSLANGYVPLDGAITTGSGFWAQAMMLQSVNKDNSLVNPERLSKNYRSTVTASDSYSAGAVFQ